MSSVYSRLYVHLVWATRERRPVLDDRSMRRLGGRMASLCTEHGCLLLASGGIADHVHLLVSLHPSVAVADLVKYLKGSTSQFVQRIRYDRDFSWQQGYGAFTLRETERDVVYRYVLNQPRHHAEGTTQTEWEQTTCDPTDVGSLHQ